MRRICLMALSVLTALAYVVPVFASGDIGPKAMNHNETFLRDAD
jgi:hypothetical protein